MGPEGANTPFFSPDGRWLGFVASGYLKKISVSGGAALTLGLAPAPTGATWGTDGSIIFVPSTASIMEQISDAGGAARAVTHLSKGEAGHSWPELLPGGKALLFVSSLGLGSTRIDAQLLSSGERRELVAD